jgi:hypothetical protein
MDRTVKASKKHSNAALVIVHLSSVDSYAWQVGQEAGDRLARSLIAAVRKHKGPVYIVDQGWDGPLQGTIKQAIADVPVTWMRFDEDVQSWDTFLPRLKKRLQRDGVTRAVVGGVWYDPALKEGCATTVYLYLLRDLPTEVDRSIVGCIGD